MSKRRRGKNDPKLFPETEDLIALLTNGDRQEVVILVIPSHTKRQEALGPSVQGTWSTEARILFADLYRGATAFQALKGIFKTDEGIYLHDDPILVESYATEAAIMDSNNLNRLVGFAKRMGRETKQEAVMLVVGQIMFLIDDYSGVD